MHHIFIRNECFDFLTNKITINKTNDYDNFNHLVKALRVKVNEYVLCSIIPFNNTFDYKCIISAIDNDNIFLDICEKKSSNEFPFTLNLYQGIPKQDKIEYIVEKSVELGITSIIPLETKFCIAKIENNKEEKKLERLNKISKSSAEQCKRNIIPLVDKKITFDNLIKKSFSENTYNLLFYEEADGINNTKKIFNDIHNKLDNNENITINIIIGPEGGFSNEEILKAKNANFNILSLGKRILRTETASIVALSMLLYEFG